MKGILRGSDKKLMRAAAFLLALVFAVVLFPVSALGVTVPKDPVKDPSGVPHGSTYHVDAPDSDGTLPVQRQGLAMDPLECMQDARSAVLIEGHSGQQLLALNPDEQLPMASTTKTMTALVVLENCSPDEEVTAMSEAVGVEGSSLYLAYGERLTVRDLLYGLMLRSGNDCAVALAIHTAGSVEEFADMMNERAARLGLVHTHFVTPNGLHDKDHYTSAYELALIAAEALKNEVFREIVSTKYYTIESSTRSITVKNKNTMLWNYDGCVGIKTGYTAAAGRCLLFAAERDGMLLVGCVLNCRPMFEVAAEMLDFGFEQFSVMHVLEKGAPLGICSVEGGTASVVPVCAGGDVYAPMRKGELMNAEVVLELDDSVSVPVTVGMRLGTAKVMCGSVLLGSVPVVANGSSALRSFRFYIDYLIKLFTHS